MKVNGKSPFVIVMALAIATLIGSWGFKLYRDASRGPSTPIHFGSNWFSSSKTAPAVEAKAPVEAAPIDFEKHRVMATTDWTGVDTPIGVFIYVDVNKGSRVQFALNRDYAHPISFKELNGREHWRIDWSIEPGSPPETIDYNLYLKNP